MYHALHFPLCVFILWFLYIFLSVALESKRCWLNDSSLFRKRLSIHQFKVQTATAENKEQDTLSNVTSIPSNPFKLWLFPLRSTLKQGLHRCRQITWKIPVMVFIFLTKLQVGVSSSTKDVFLSKYFSRFLLGFVVIYQNLPTFCESLFPRKMFMLSLLTVVRFSKYLFRQKLYIQDRTV